MKENEELTFVYEEYPSYAKREEIKNRAWKGFHSGDDRVKVHCLLHGIIWVHYWRAREFLEDNPKLSKKLSKEVYKDNTFNYSLDIDKYTNHWLYSMKEKVPDSTLDLLKKEWGYKPKESKYLPKGHTCYCDITKAK